MSKKRNEMKWKETFEENKNKFYKDFKSRKAKKVVEISNQKKRERWALKFCLRFVLGRVCGVVSTIMMLMMIMTGEPFLFGFTVIFITNKIYKYFFSISIYGSRE